MEKRYNLKSPAVKRLMREAKELCEPTDQYYAQPLEDNLFEWHFTVQGPADSDFENGRYHGRITLPPEYPMKPPSIMLLTPNGRFETGRKICLSMSAHHPETWQPSWSIRTVLLAIIGFMPTKGGGAIGALDYTPEERQVLAKRSILWKCNVCDSCNSNALKEMEPGRERKSNKELQELASQITFKGESETKTEDVPTTAADGVTSNGDVSSDAINTSNVQSLDDTPPLPEGEGLEQTTPTAQQDRSARKVRKRAVKRSSSRGYDGQNSARIPTPTGSGFLSTLLVVLLITCLFVLLVRRIFKDYYHTEST